MFSQTKSPYTQLKIVHALDPGKNLTLRFFTVALYADVNKEVSTPPVKETSFPPKETS